MKRSEAQGRLSGLQTSTAQWATDLEQLGKELNQPELTAAIKAKFQSLTCSWEALLDTMRRQQSVLRIVQQKRMRKEQRRKARTQELDVMEEEIRDKEKTWQRSLQHLHHLLSDGLQKTEDFARKTTARRRKYHESQKVQIQADEQELLGMITAPPAEQETRLRPAISHSPARAPSPEDSQISEQYDQLMDELAAQQAQVNVLGVSMDKDVGGWDSSLDSEHPSFVASASADEIKRALMYLKKASLFSPVTFTQRNQHVLQQLGQLLVDSKDPSDAEAAVLLIKAQQRKNTHERKQSFPPKPPTPPHKPGWKRSLHISQPVEASIDLASTTPKGEMMHAIEGPLDKTLTSNPPQSTHSLHPNEEHPWKPEAKEDSLLDVKLEDILKVPSFMGTEVTVHVEEEKAITEGDSGQTAGELDDQVLPFREIKAPPSSTRKKKEATDYHYTGQTYQGSTKGSSGLKSKIALRTAEAEDSHFRLTGQSQSVLMTPQTKEKAL